VTPALASGNHAHHHRRDILILIVARLSSRLTRYRLSADRHLALGCRRCLNVQRHVLQRTSQFGRMFVDRIIRNALQRSCKLVEITGPYAATEHVTKNPMVR